MKQFSLESLFPPSWKTFKTARNISEGLGHYEKNVGEEPMQEINEVPQDGL